VSEGSSGQVGPNFLAAFPGTFVPRILLLLVYDIDSVFKISYNGTKAKYVVRMEYRIR